MKTGVDRAPKFTLVSRLAMTTYISGGKSIADHPKDPLFSYELLSDWQDDWPNIYSSLVKKYLGKLTLSIPRALTVPTG